MDDAGCTRNWRNLSQRQKNELEVGIYLYTRLNYICIYITLMYANMSTYILYFDDDGTRRRMGILFWNGCGSTNEKKKNPNLTFDSPLSPMRYTVMLLRMKT